MLKSALHRSTSKFEKQFGYNADYMHQIIDASTGAGMRLGLLPVLSQYKGPKTGQDVWAGAGFASTLDGDCGSCAQLFVDQAKELGVNPKELEVCSKGNARTDSDCGLGFLFAQAAILGTQDALELRAEIVRRHGEQTAVAASFAAACGRIYPVLKRATGSVTACNILNFGSESQIAAE